MPKCRKWHKYAIRGIIKTIRRANLWLKNMPLEQLNKLNKKDLMLLVLSMQDQLTQMNDNLEKLIEQIRIANQQHFGRHTETLDAVSGQLSLFNEAEALAEDTTEELTIEEVLATIPKQKKQRGKRDADLSGFAGRKDSSQCLARKT